MKHTYDWYPAWISSFYGLLIVVMAEGLSGLLHVNVYYVLLFFGFVFIVIFWLATCCMLAEAKEM